MKYGPEARQVKFRLQESEHAEIENVCQTIELSPAALSRLLTLHCIRSGLYKEIIREKLDSLEA